MARPQVIATVASLSGEAYARNSAGTVRRVYVGDVITEGETVVSSVGGQVVLEWVNDRGVTVYSGQATRSELSPGVPTWTEQTDEELARHAKAIEKVTTGVEGQGFLPVIVDNPVSEVANESAAVLTEGGHTQVEYGRVFESLVASVAPAPFIPLVGDGGKAPSATLLAPIRAVALHEVPPPYLTARLDPASDSGRPGDGISSDRTPTLSGRGNPGASIQVALPDGEIVTTTVRADGTWAATPSWSLPDGPCVVTVTATDPGGTGYGTTIPLQIDTTPPNGGTAPTVVITEDANNDGYIIKAEAIGNADVKVLFDGSKVAVGDTVRIASGAVTHEVVITTTDQAAGFVTTSFSPQADGTTMNVTAIIVDVAGNASAQGSDSAIIDTSVPNAGVAPMVEITEDANNDGYISKAEAIGNADVKVSFDGSKVAVGDKVEITSGSTTNEAVISATDKSNGYVTTSFAPQADGTTMTVKATIVDTAGNKSAEGSDSAIIDTTVPNAGVAPTVEITEDANNDGYISKAEAIGNADVKVSFDGSKVDVGDKVEITSNGVTNEAIISATDKTNGYVTTSFAPQADGTTMTVKATIVDAAGNRSAEGSDSAIIDTTATVVPSVTITTDANNDAFINKTELGSATTIAVSVGVPAGAKAGDTLTLTDGTTTQTHVLTAADITAGSWSATVAKPAEGATLNVAATLTDAAGNVSAPATDGAVLDTTVPNAGVAPTVEITEDANNDGYISKAEAIGNADVKVSFDGSKVAVGDKAEVTSNGVTNEVVISATDKTHGYVTTSFAPQADGTTMTVQAIIIDAAGNKSAEGSDSAIIDTTVPNAGVAPTVEITEDANNDGYISKAEAIGNADVKVSFDGSKVTVGDVVKISSGSVTNDVIISATDQSHGYVMTSFAPQADGTTMTVTAVIIDAAGNKSAEGSDSAIIDTSVPNNSVAPTVVITEDANNDGFISKAEAIGNADVKVSFDGSNVAVGDKVEITSNGVTSEVVIGTADKTNGYVMTSFTPRADGATMSVKAIIVDAAGNKSAEGSDSAIIDTAVPNGGTGPTVEITEDANNDGYISKAEAIGNADVKVSFDGSKVAVGDTVKITSGSATNEVIISDTDQTNGYVTTSFAPQASGTTMTVAAVIVDAAGNTSAQGSDSAIIDTSAPNNSAAPTVVITEDANNDGYINQAEAIGNADVKVSFDGGKVAIGDIVKITTGAVTNEVIISDTDQTNGYVTTSFAPQASGTTMTVTAAIVDALGNASAQGNDSAIIDLAVPNVGVAPTVEITEDANNDGYISKAEAIGNADVKVSFDGTTVAVGDKVEITSGSTTNEAIISATDKANGYLMTSFAPQADGTTMTVKAIIVDAAGNKSAEGSDSAIIDTSVPNNSAAPTVAITEDANNDGYINQAEAIGNADVKVSFDGSKVVVGDTVKITSGTVTHDVIVSATDKTNGYVTTSFAPQADGTTMTVKAIIVDTAGNKSAEGSDSAIIDTTVPNAGVAPTVEITEDANNDGYISKAEAIGNADVKVSFDGSKVAVGDKVEITSNGVTNEAIISATDKSNGYVTTSFAPQADGTTMTVKATIVDTAGNKSAEGSDSAIIDTTVPNAGVAPTVEITEDANNDGYISKAEAIGNADVKVSFDGSKVDVGDKVEITLGSTTNEIIISATDKTNGYVTTSFAPQADGTTMTVKATIVDAAGNRSAEGSDSAIIDTTVPNAGVAPTVEITEDANNDGYISKGEAIGNADVKVSFDGSKVSVGDTVKITSGTVTNDVVISATYQSNGYVTTSFAPQADGTTMTVKAVIVDAARNKSAEGSDSAIIDTSVPNNSLAPTVDITQDANNDGYINQAEDVGNAGVKVSFDGSKVSVGDTVKITSGTVTNEVIISASDQTAGFVTTSFAPQANGATMSVTAVIVDAAGNSSAQGSDSAIIDTSVPNVDPNNPTASSAPTVVITEDANNDGMIVKSEAIGNADVKVSFDGSLVAVGDTVKVTSGTVTNDVVINATDQSNGFVTTSFASQASGTTMTVTAMIVDHAGNASGQGSDSAVINLNTAPILDGMQDNFSIGTNRVLLTNGSNGGHFVVSGSEVLTTTGWPVFEVWLSNVNPGEIFAFYVNGVQLQLSAANFKQDSYAQTSAWFGGNNSADLIVNEATDTFTAPAGNVAGGIYMIQIDPTIANTTINWQLTTTDPAGPGSTVDMRLFKRSDYLGQQSLSTIAQGHDNDSGDSIRGYAITSAAAEVSSAQDVTPGKWQYYDTASASWIDIPTTASVANAFFLTANTQVRWSDNDVGRTPLSMVAVDNTSPVTQGQSIDVTTRGGLTPYSETIGTLVPRNPPVVTIGEDANNNGYISQAELSGNIDVSVTLPGTAVAGDKLLVVVNGTSLAPIVLTAADIASGSVSVPGIVSPGEGSLTVTARIQDGLHPLSLSTTGSDSAVIDLTPPTATITVSSVATDNIVSVSEGASTAVPVIGTVGGYVHGGATVTLVVNGKTYTGIVAADNSYRIDVLGSDLRADADRKVDVSVTVTDVAGNSTTATAQAAYSAGTQVTVPSAAQTIVEDASRVFSSANGNAVTITDSDAPTTTVTISVIYGSLQAVVTTGVTISNNGSAVVTLSGTPADITAALNGLTYTPTADYNGTDTLTVYTSDGVGPAITKMLDVTVSAVADIVADTLSTNEDTAITANLIVGGSGASADSFENADRHITAVTQGAHGAVTFLANGAVTYTPTANWNGTDTFSYTVTSGGVTETATVTVNVAAVNDVPVDANETLTVTENTAFTPVDLLANASDADGDTLTVTVNSITGNTVTGTAVSVTDSTLSVDTAAINALTAGQTETVTVNYTVSDGHGGSKASTATVTITGVNDAPVLAATTVSAAATALATVGGSQLVSGTNVAGPQMNAAAGSTTYPTGWAGELGTGLLGAGKQLVVGSALINDAANSGWSGTYTLSNLNGTSLNGGSFLMLHFQYDNAGGGAYYTDFVHTTLTGLTAGQTYVYGFQWQQATMLGTNSWFSGGTLEVDVNGSSKSLTSASPTDGWQTVLLGFTATGSTADVKFSATMLDYNDTGFPAGYASNESGSYGSLLAIDTLSKQQIDSINLAPATGVALSTIAPATDADNAGSIRGYAITSAAAETVGADSSPGKWQYYDTTSTTWKDIPTTASVSAAFFLTADTKVRWLDDDNTHTALSLVAVDNTSAATQGQTIDVSTRGGTTAFSASVATLAAGTGPVVIDANHDGVISYGRAVMDVNGDGVLDSTAWAGKGDGVLLWNRYGDGQVHDASQYAFGQQFGGTDLQALAKGFDSNQDGVFDAKDAAYSQFGVWQDANGDGKVEPGEFKTLADLGIVSLKLSSDGVQRTDQPDVVESGRTTASTSTGEMLTVADVTFSYDTAASAMQNATTTQLVAGAHVQSLSGVDVFAWHLADATSVSPETIDNFDARATAAGGDVLDLRDLLVGEAHAGTDAGNLASYLHFSVANGDTTIAIKSAGKDVTQNLVLKGVDLTVSGANDAAIIHDLLAKGKLIAD